MKDQIKFVEKSIPNLQQMGMQFMSMGTQEELRDQIVAKAIDIACLQDPLPIDAASFNKRKDEGKSRLVLLVNEIARLAAQVLAEFHGLPKRLQGVNQQAAADMQEQLKGLVHKRFVIDTEFAQLSHFPRYLKAMNVRLEKLRADPARDAKAMAEWHQAAQPYLRVMRDKSAGKNTDPKLVGGVARVAVRAGVADTDAGVGQASVQGMGIDAAMKKAPRRGACCMQRRISTSCSDRCWCSGSTGRPPG
jgi:ATP-dependent helicase HrpA